MLGVLLVATVFVRNLYCRFLCPVGAVLGLLSNLTVFRIKRWSECKTCRICEKTCEWGAIRGPKIVMTECVRCDDCERLYVDKKKCPHHLIIIRKADIMARRSVAPARSSRPLRPDDDQHLVGRRHDHAFDTSAAARSAPSPPAGRDEHARRQRVGETAIGWRRSSRCGVPRAGSPGVGIEDVVVAPAVLDEEALVVA